MNTSFGAAEIDHPAGARAPALRRVNVGLLWHSASSGNLGVGALTVANMAIVRDVAAKAGLDPQFTILSMRDGEAVYVDPQDAPVFVIDTKALFSPAGCWSAIGAQDLLLDIGAGDSFADIYGPKRFFFLWWTKMIAIWRRRPLMLSPQTIGPFTRAGYRPAARMALEGARSVVARDDVSMRALQELAPRARGVQSVDVAFALPYEDRSAERGGPRLKVGINVSGLLFNEAVSGRNRFGLSIDYAQLMRRFIAELCEQGAEVHLICHVVAPDYAEDDDRRVAEQLHTEFPATVVSPTFGGPIEAKSYISGLDFLVAGRMHACIAAYSSGTPVVPVAYSRKFSGLFGMLGYSWLVPTSGVETEQALDFLRSCLKDRAKLAAEEARGMVEVEGLLDAYRAELRDLMLAAVRL